MLNIASSKYIINQEEALSNASTLNYDALVSDFGDNSQDSSMIPDNESEVSHIMKRSVTWLVKTARAVSRGVPRDAAEPSL